MGYHTRGSIMCICTQSWDRIAMVTDNTIIILHNYVTESLDAGDLKYNIYT